MSSVKNKNNKNDFLSVCFGTVRERERKRERKEGGLRVCV